MKARHLNFEELSSFVVGVLDKAQDKRKRERVRGFEEGGEEARKSRGRHILLHNMKQTEGREAGNGNATGGLSERRVKPFRHHSEHELTLDELTINM